MLAACIAGVFLLAPPKFDFYAHKPYEAAVPVPDATLGYRIGERHTTFRDQEIVLSGIASAAGNRVKTIEFGKSWEGRPLRLFVVSSAANMARLEEIRKRNLERAEGKSVGAGDPVLVWINQCIHGNETASFESAMPLLYNLVASRNPRIREMLDRAVVLINPVYNPDGHERYVVFYNSVAMGSTAPGAYEATEPGVIYGRYNHYRFDMNRDRVAMSQAETRAESEEFRRWYPQVYVDQHGQVDTYFFPPNAMSQNVNADRDRLNKWTEVFGRATGRSFDEQGWTYFIRETFDFYHPGYLDSYATLQGAIGMTHETDGGRLLARRRADDTLLTLRDGAMKHFTSAVAVIESAGSNRSDLLTSFISYKRKAVTGEAAGNFKRVVVTGDGRALRRLKELLERFGVRSFVTSRGFSQSAHDYWDGGGEAKMQAFPAGSLIVDMAQPQGQHAKTLLEPGSDFEPEFLKSQLGKKKTAPEGETYPGPEGIEFYDATGWALPFAHNLRAWWCESAPPIPQTLRADPDPADHSFVIQDDRPSTVGYAIIYRDQDDILAVFDALNRGVKGMITTREMTLGRRTYPAGTFLFMAARNEDGYEKTLKEAAKGRGALVFPLETSFPDSGRQGPGSENVITLRKPQIAIAFGTMPNLAQVGGIWYLMDQVFKLKFTPLSTSALSSADLSRYTCVIVPSGAGATTGGKLGEWVRGGGCVVGLGGLNWATGSGGFVDLANTGVDGQELPGSIFRAELDRRSFLSYGYGGAGAGPIPIAVPVEGSTFLKARKEGGSVVRFSDDEKVAKLLTGWAWPDETEKALRGAVWLQDMPVGRGHAVLFTFDPTHRAQWPGLHMLLLNAMLIGPST